MTHDTIKISIIKYLEENGDWVFGGKLARELAYRLEHKESVIERRCRELVESGSIEKSLVQIDGKGPRVVRYRIVPEIKLPPAYKPQEQEYNETLL